MGCNSLNRPHLGSLSNVNVIYTSLKSIFRAQQFPPWQWGSIFIRLAVVASQTCQLAQNCKKNWSYSSSSSHKVNDFGTNRRYSSSRSSSVDDLGTNQKCICEFLLMINSKFGPVLHSFWDTATCWLKIAYFSYTCHLAPHSLSSL